MMANIKQIKLSVKHLIVIIHNWWSLMLVKLMISELILL
jgi:hypothetical protein